jgi:hypothetical protein
MRFGSIIIIAFKTGVDMYVYVRRNPDLIEMEDSFRELSSSKAK